MPEDVIGDRVADNSITRAALLPSDVIKLAADGIP
jgi:hypothetical protein